MKAILLAGGLGARLRPITITCPKPLLPIGNIPLIKRIVLNLRAQGIKDFVFLLHYQPDKFISFLRDGKDYNARFQYVIMEKDLSTAGSVKYAQAYITRTTLIYSADILAEIPIRRMLAFHKRRRAMVTLALHPISTPLPYGLVLRERDGRIRRFFEKPTWPQVFSDWINTGIYIIEPALLDHIPEDGRPIFFEQEVFPPLAAANAAIFGFPVTGYWRDVGTPEDLRMANLDYLQRRLSKEMLEQSELRTSTDAQSLAASASLTLIGNSCEIAPEAHIANSTIGSHCQIESHARVSGSVIFDHVRIGSGAHLQDAIVMSGVEIEAQAEIRHNAVLAENVRIGATAVVEANAVIRNDREIAPSETVTAKRVLPTGYLRRFVDGGSLLGSVAGGLGVDFMRWVGNAFALRQSKQGTRGKGQIAEYPLLLATQEGERFSVWARALAQGLVAAGSEVHLLESVTLPVARWILQKGRHAGGIYLATDSLSGLLRLALMHPTGEDFATEESCALERIDLTEARVTGKLHLLDALRLREDYLRMVINTVWSGAGSKSMGAFLPVAGAVLDRPVPVRIGVLGEAAEKITQKFFDMLDWPVKTDVFSLERSTEFRRHLRHLQKTFAQSITPEVGVGLWLDGVGERVQLALPELGMLPFGRSDIAIARLLLKENPEAKLVLGWLFPDLPEEMTFDQISSAIRYGEGCMLTTASLRAQGSETRILGFDGRGAVAISLPTKPFIKDGMSGASSIAYPDAFMALAFLLRVLLKTSRAELQAMISNTRLGYRLMPCPDEAKAYLVRQLVEVHDLSNCAFSDGIRFDEKTPSPRNFSPNWVVVRPCAGREALEIFWQENPSLPSQSIHRKSGHPSLSVSIRRRLASLARYIRSGDAIEKG